MSDAKQNNRNVAMLFSKQMEKDDIAKIIEVLEDYDMEVDEVSLVSRYPEVLKEKMFDLFMKDFSLVITFGAIGLKEDDIVPEITASLIDKRLPGLETAIMYSLLEKGSYSIINRGVAGVFHDTIVVNLPSKPFLVKQILYTVLPLIKHGIKHIEEK